MGAKTSKRYSSLKSLLNIYKLFLNFLLSGIHKSTVLDFWNVEFMIFHDFFRVTMGSYGSQNVKTLLLPQIMFDFFPKFSWIFFLVVLTKVLFGLLKFWVFNFFCTFKIHHLTSWNMRDGHVVTMYINRKPYMESQMTPSHLTLRHLEGQSQCLRFWSLPIPSK